MINLTPRDRAELALETAQHVVSMMAANEGKPVLMDARGLANALNVSSSTLDRWITEGRIPIALRVGNVRRFALDEVLTALSGEHAR